MDPKQFDNLTRWLATPRSRRQSPWLIAGSLAGSVLSACSVLWSGQAQATIPSCDTCSGSTVSTSCLCPDGSSCTCQGTPSNPIKPVCCSPGHCCTPGTNTTHGDNTCDSSTGTCIAIATCQSKLGGWWNDCAGYCVNLQADNNNCGSCGVHTPIGGSCVNGVPTCPAGQSNCNGTCVNSLPPTIAVTPTSLDFGSSVPILAQWVTVANSSGCQSLTMTLNTNGPFFITKGTITGPVPVQSVNDTVGPQSSGQYLISFMPTTAGLASGTLVISSNDPVHPTITVPLSGTGVNNAMFCAQSSIQILECDREVQVTMQNTGNTTWTTAHGYRLGSQNPQDNNNWDVNRVDLPNDVPPGQSVTFDFWINAMVPANHTYNYQWRMVQDGIAWFGDFTPNQRVLVVRCNK